LAFATQLTSDVTRSAATGQKPVDDGIAVPPSYGSSVGAYPLDRPVAGLLFGYGDLGRPTPEVGIEYRWLRISDKANGLGRIRLVPG